MLRVEASIVLIFIVFEFSNDYFKVWGILDFKLYEFNFLKK